MVIYTYLYYVWWVMLKMYILVSFESRYLGSVNLSIIVWLNVALIIFWINNTSLGRGCFHVKFSVLVLFLLSKLFGYMWALYWWVGWISLLVWNMEILLRGEAWRMDINVSMVIVEWNGIVFNGMIVNMVGSYCGLLF